MNDEGHRIEVGAVLAAAATDIRALAPQFLLMLIVASAVGGAAAYLLPGSNNMIGNFALFFVKVLTIHHILRMRLGKDDIRLRFGAAFGFSLLSGLAVMVGLGLFLIPGLLFAVRWAVGMPALLNENIGVTDAMARSRALTAGSRWNILALLLLLWVPYLLLMGLMGALVGAFGGTSAVESMSFDLVINLGAGAMAVFGAACWTEAYIILSGAERADSALAEIFA